jgi:hypothetical protein
LQINLEIGSENFVSRKLVQEHTYQADDALFVIIIVGRQLGRLGNSALHCRLGVPSVVLWGGGGLQRVVTFVYYMLILAVTVQFIIEAFVCK